MADITTTPVFAPRIPWRLFGMAFVVIALLALVAFAYAGAQTTKPAPAFGVARNGLLVYSAKGDIYAADPATGATKAIIAGPESDHFPQVSRDGTKLAFLRSDPTASAYNLFVANADGSDVHIASTMPLPFDPGVYDWAPDGASLLVQNDTTMLRVDAAGTATPVILSAQAIGIGNSRPPAGAQQLYEPQELDYHSIWAMNTTDGSGKTELVGKDNGLVLTTGEYGFLAKYSPDGTQIAFSQQPIDQSSMHVFVMNADGTGIRPLTRESHATWETDLVWSPDGKQIAFNRWASNGIQPIGVVSVDGDGTVRSVGPTPVPEGALFDWSPDGTSILSLPASMLGEGVAAAPVLINAADGTSTTIAPTPGSDISWQRTAP